MFNNPTSLSLERVKEILPKEYTINTIFGFAKDSINSTMRGELLAIRNSKKYTTDYYWFCCTIDTLSEKGVKNVCFVCGFEGLFILSIDFLKPYTRTTGWKTLKNNKRSYYVRIRKRKGKYYLFGSQEEDIDITDYFVNTTEK